MKQLVRQFASCPTLNSLGQFFIATKDNNACPFLKAGYFVHFKIGKWVCAQPIDFLTGSGKTVNPLIMIGKIAGRNVGLAQVRASKVAQSFACQEVYAGRKFRIEQQEIGRNATSFVTLGI